MNEMKKIAVLDDMVEAQLLESMLEEKGIPHLVHSYHDSAYDGLFQMQKGWGYVEAPQDHEEEVLTLLRELRTRTEEPR